MLNGGFEREIKYGRIAQVHALSSGEQIVTFGIQMGIVLRTLEILGTESGVVGVDSGSGVVHINDSIFQASGLDAVANCLDAREIYVPGSHPSDDRGGIICLERRAKGVQPAGKNGKSLRWECPRRNTAGARNESGRNDEFPKLIESHKKYINLH